MADGSTASLGIDAFAAVAATRPTLDIMPNLRTMEWGTEDYAGLIAATLFMNSPSLSRLEISVGETMDRPLFGDYLRELPNRCLNLTHLSLGFGIPMSHIQVPFVEMLSALRGLRELEIPGFCFTADVLTQVASLPLLEKAGTRPIASIELHGDIADVATLRSALPLPPDSFPFLRALRFDATLSTSHAVLSDIQISRSLRSLFIATLPTQTEEPEAVKQFLTFLSAEFPLIDDLGLGLLSQPPPIAAPSPPLTFDALRPALGLKQMEQFYLSFNLVIELTDADIREIAAAWGSKLRVLWFWSPLYSPTQPLETSMTLANLGTFAECFPQLRDLGIYVDGKRTPTKLPSAESASGSGSGSVITPFARLRELNVGISDIGSENTLSAALWLAEFVPYPFSLIMDTGWSLEYAHVSEDDSADVLEPRADKWREVSTLHAQLWEPRFKQRVKTQQMEREMEELRGRERVLMEKIRMLEEQLKSSGDEVVDEVSVMVFDSEECVFIVMGTDDVRYRELTRLT